MAIYSSPIAAKIKLWCGHSLTPSEEAILWFYLLRSLPCILLTLKSDIFLSYLYKLYSLSETAFCHLSVGVSTFSVEAIRYLLKILSGTWVAPNEIFWCLILLSMMHCFCLSKALSVKRSWLTISIPQGSSKEMNEGAMVTELWWIFVIR